MCKYVKRPVVVEAVKFEDSIECFDKLMALGLDPVRVDYADRYNPVIKIDTLEGEMTGQVGDYIIRGVNGEFYPCKPDIFVKTYEAVGDIKKNLSFTQAFELLRTTSGNYMRLPEWEPDVKLRMMWPEGFCGMTYPFLYVAGRFRETPWNCSEAERSSEEWEVGFDE